MCQLLQLYLESVYTTHILIILIICDSFENTVFSTYHDCLFSHIFTYIQEIRYSMNDLLTEISRVSLIMVFLMFYLLENNFHKFLFYCIVFTSPSKHSYIPVVVISALTDLEVTISTLLGAKKTFIQRLPNSTSAHVRASLVLFVLFQFHTKVLQ